MGVGAQTKLIAATMLHPFNPNPTPTSSIADTDVNNTRRPSFWACLNARTGTSRISFDRLIQVCRHPLARVLPLLFTVPALALYARDVAYYTQYQAYAGPAIDASTPAPAANAVTIVDGLAIAFLGLAIVRSLHFAAVYLDPWGRFREWQARVRLEVFFAFDVLLWLALLALGDTTLALRAAGAFFCDPNVDHGGCWATKAQRVQEMRAAGAMMVLAAVAYQLLWILALHAWLMKRRMKNRPPSGSRLVPLASAGA